jgi:zeaxanthin epoxidase
MMTMPCEAGGTSPTACCAALRCAVLCCGLVRRYIKFDTFHPAVSKGLPVTRVISRITLQEILADAVDRLCPPDKVGSIIRNSANVVSFQETQDPATGAW